MFKLRLKEKSTRNKQVGIVEKCDIVVAGALKRLMEYRRYCVRRQDRFEKDRFSDSVLICHFFP